MSCVVSERRAQYPQGLVKAFLSGLIVSLPDGVNDLGATDHLAGSIGKHPKNLPVFFLQIGGTVTNRNATAYRIEVN
jgi:hypothetical protein